MTSVSCLTAPDGAVLAAHRTGRLMRVLYAIKLDPSKKFGSLEEQILTLAQAFREREGLFLPVFFAAPGERGRDPYREAGLPVEFLDLTHFRPGTLHRLLRLVARERIEVIHWNFSSPLFNHYLWPVRALAPRVRHYFTDHNSRPLPLPPPASPLQRRLKKALLKNYTRVLGVSRYVVECIERQRTWPRADCCLHFINTRRFTPNPGARAAARGRLGAGERFVLLTVAHLIPDKGVDVVIRAVRETPDRVHLWVAGEGAERDRLESLARELGLGQRVRFLGLRGEVEPYMQAADCLVCPSLWAEAAGLVNIEAQACGLPVLASDVGGIPEYVLDGRTGFLFPPGGHTQLAERIRLLASDPELCRTLGQRARAWAVEQFSAEARLEQYLDLYRM